MKCTHKAVLFPYQRLLGSCNLALFPGLWDMSNQSAPLCVAYSRESGSYHFFQRMARINADSVISLRQNQRRYFAAGFSILLSLQARLARIGAFGYPSWFALCSRRAFKALSMTRVC